MKLFHKKSLAALSVVLMLGISGLAMAEDVSELQGDVVEYDVRTGLMKADGHVVLKREGGVATGSYAEFNAKTQEGFLTGGVVAERSDEHLVCETVHIMGGTQIIAEGNVCGRKAEKTYEGPRAEYASDTEYVRMPLGGTITTADGSFAADYMESWMQENHARGVGNVCIKSPKRNFEGGGDEAEYFGSDSGKVILTGNAWGIQDNNRLKSQRLTVYLDQTGQAAAEAEDAPRGKE